MIWGNHGLVESQRTWDHVKILNDSALDVVVNHIDTSDGSAVVDIIERIIRSNDKPRAEVIIDVQILEVNRQRVKRLGLNLSEYALGLTFSPEVAPAADWAWVLKLLPYVIAPVAISVLGGTKAHWVAVVVLNALI